MPLPAFDAPFWLGMRPLTDSRRPFLPEESVFFAIRGERHNGHDFIPMLFERGVRKFVVEEPVGCVLPGAELHQVESSVGALQGWAAHHRRQFAYPVVGITGSNGKTIVKEWMSQMLAGHFALVKSPKSWNSQLGVPLSVLEMRPEYNLALFEAGISQMGEMERLAEMLRPDWGIFTNIGTAHDEGFPDRQTKIREKLRLFAHCSRLLLCADHRLLMAEAKAAQLPVFSWGKAEEADLRLVQSQPLGQQGLACTFATKEGAWTLNLPFRDEASVENAGHCIAAWYWLGLPMTDLQERLAHLRNLPMRMELKAGIADCTLIDDSYSNDLVGLQASLAFLSQQAGNKPKTVILSDVAGAEAADYGRIATELQAAGVSRLIGIGSLMQQQARQFAHIPRCAFLADVPQFLAQWPGFQREAILLKGARQFALERLMPYLTAQIHGTTLEIDLTALAHNLNHFRARLGRQVKLMVMVKALAYGSGSTETARILSHHRVDYLAVAYTSEGIALRQQGIHLPIMVLNAASANFPQLVSHRLDPEVYSLRQCEQLVAFLRDTNAQLTAHLKIETGMNRLGFREADLAALIALLQACPHLRVGSIFTHLAVADDPAEQAFTQQQLERYERMYDRLAKALGYHPLRHALNTAGIQRFPQAQMDMVRLGIGLYGVSPKPEDQAQLLQVGRLKASISQIHTVSPGDTIGYGRLGKVTRPGRSATVTIGYADGYDRRFGQGVGQMLVNGQLCPTWGSVCMDMTMIDVTNAKCQEGDSVLVYGQGWIKAAQSIGTIPYELLTNVSERVKRVFFED